MRSIEGFDRIAQATDHVFLGRRVRRIHCIRVEHNDGGLFCCGFEIDVADKAVLVAAVAEECSAVAAV